MRPIASLSLLALIVMPAFADPIDDPNLETPDADYATSGLILPESEALVIEEQELVIGPSEIRGEYVIRNMSDQPVTSDMVLPLPAFGLHAAWALDGDDITPLTVHDRVALFDATVTVDGVAVPLTTEAIAVIEPGGGVASNPSLQFALHEPGKVITEKLLAFGLPLTINPFEAEAALLALTPAERAEVKALGLAGFSAPNSAGEISAWPNWRMLGRLRWSQVFPPGTEVRISYQHWNFATSWHREDEDVARWAQDYCIDTRTSEAMVRAMTFQMEELTLALGDGYQMTHVWRTNPPSGPAGKFRLRIEPGVPGGVAAACVPGLTRSSSSAFEWEGKDFAPSDDLKILIIAPLPPE
jgi:hypothetical protein